jgi:integrase
VYLYYTPLLHLQSREIIEPRSCAAIVGQQSKGKEPAAGTTAAGITEGKIFRAVRKGGKVWSEDLTPGAVLQIVQQYTRKMGLEKLAPHDMRRTCVLCRKRGSDLEQIKFLLGHASIQTTERYLGAEQDFVSAVNDNLGLDRN